MTLPPTQEIQFNVTRYHPVKFSSYWESSEIFLLVLRLGEETSYHGNHAVDIVNKMLKKARNFVSYEKVIIFLIQWSWMSFIWQCC